MRKSVDGGAFFETFCNRVVSETPSRSHYFTTDEINRWSKSCLKALKKSNLILRASPSKRVICPGCAEQCSRPVEIRHALSAGSKRYAVACDWRDDMGWIPIPQKRLQRWRSSLELILRFLAEQLDLPVPLESFGKCFLRFGSLTVNNDRIAISVGIDDGFHLCVGDQTVRLAEIVMHGKDGFSLDRDKLDAIAQIVARLKKTDTNYQSSKLTRELKKHQTVLRNRKLQDAYLRIKKKYPGYSKPRIAKAIVDSGAFPGISAMRIERIIRVPENR